MTEEEKLAREIVAIVEGDDSLPRLDNLVRYGSQYHDAKGLLKGLALGRGNGKRNSMSLITWEWQQQRKPNESGASF